MFAPRVLRDSTNCTERRLYVGNPFEYSAPYVSFQKLQSPNTTNSRKAPPTALTRSSHGISHPGPLGTQILQLLRLFPKAKCQKLIRLPIITK